MLRLMARKKRKEEANEAVASPASAPAAYADGVADSTRAYPSDPRGWKLDNLAGVRLLESFKFKQIQIAFTREPGDEIRDKLAQAGFVFRDSEGIFTKQLGDAPAQTRYRAEGLYAEICDMIREREGLTSREQPPF